MNIFSAKILLHILDNGFSNQRILATELDISLGIVNKSLQELKQDFYLSKNNQITDKADKLFSANKPRNAIILAAGYGMRMVPINTECPKGLLTVNNEKLIERLIKQLHIVGVTDISIVVGFMKDSFEFLIDKYNVKLIYNKDYSTKNNLFSLNCASTFINNSYIIPCDIWCSTNPFNNYELFSWYSVTKVLDSNSTVRITRNFSIESTTKKQPGNSMIGIAYVNSEDSKILKKNLKELCKQEENNTVFWEKAFLDATNINVFAKVLTPTNYVEINSYEQLRELDVTSKNLQTDSISIIAKTLNCNTNEIYNITTLKKGMTNRSFLFEYKNQKYIMRIPGEGTDLLINRAQEAQVYNLINDYNICDPLVYINPQNGYKISKYIENSRVCDSYNTDDLRKCMYKLRTFHELNLQVDHTFDIFEKINLYENLWNGAPSCFQDYNEVKNNIFSLKEFVEQNREAWSLTHIDAVPDNFLFSTYNGVENIQLIDWEYSGMQDPHVDIAMFCIYSLYDSKKQVDRVIDFYFPEGVQTKIRIKIYCYMAICGLLWSNWCEYKSKLGVEFGEYSLRQYRYAKDYYKIAISELEKWRIKNA